MSESNDLKLLQFVETSGASVDVAKKFLEANGYNLENSLNLYFTNPSMFDGASTQPMQQDVRAPIAAQFQTLAGPANNFVHRSGAVRNEEPFRNYGAEWTRGASKKDERGLATLFSPPTYVFKGDLERACEAAEAQKKWVLVNIQSTAEFASHVLNRDCWKDTARLAPIISNNFIFCQRDIASQFGTNFRNLYPQVYKVPSVSIVNPITRALAADIPMSNLPTVQEIMNPIVEFIEKNPHPIVPGFNTNNPKPVDEDAEMMDSEVKKAIAMSLADERMAQGKTNPSPEEEVAPVRQEPDVQTQFFNPPQAEPAKGPQTTRLQIRLPDGKTVKRRFLKNATLSELYSVIEHENQREFADLNKYCLMQTFPKQQLGNDKLSQTLQDLGLTNCAVVLSAL